MKAVVYENYGPPEVLHLMDVETPVPNEHEILIKIYSSTVNRTDCGFLRAKPFIVRFFSGFLKPKNRILGNEFSGIVESTGRNVTLFKKGDRVFGYNGTTFGAHAGYIVMNEAGTISHIPPGFSFDEAAPLTEGAHYALSNIKAAGIRKGQDVLINGTTGAIGSAAVQLVKYLGAGVTAVCNTKNIDLVRSLGADHVIDYSKSDFTRINKRFDVVIDAVGKSSFGKCKPLLKEGGIYSSTDLGFMSQNIFLSMITPLLGGRKVIFPVPRIKKEDLIFLGGLAASGAFKPVIDSFFPMEEVVEAFRYVESGQKTGNVILRISDE